MFLSILVGIYCCIAYLMNLPKNIIFFTVFIVGIFSGFIDWKKIKNLGVKFSNILYIVTIIILIMFFVLENNLLIYTLFTIFLGASFSSIYDYFNNLESDKHILSEENNKLHVEKIDLAVIHKNLYIENEKLNHNILRIESDLKNAKDEIHILGIKKYETEKELKKSQIKLQNLHNFSQEIESKRKMLELEKAQIKEKEYSLIQEKNNLQKKISLAEANTNEIKQLQQILSTKNKDLELARKQEKLKSQEWDKLEKENTKAIFEINKINEENKKLNDTVNEYIKVITDKENCLKPLQIQDEFITTWINIEKLLKNKSQFNFESAKQIDLLFQQGEINFKLKNKLHDIRKRRNEIVHNKFEVDEIHENEVHEIKEVAQELKRSLFN